MEILGCDLETIIELVQRPPTIIVQFMRSQAHPVCMRDQHSATHLLHPDVRILSLHTLDKITAQINSPAPHTISRMTVWPSEECTEYVHYYVCLTKRESRQESCQVITCISFFILLIGVGSFTQA